MKALAYPLFIAMLGLSTHADAWRTSQPSPDQVAKVTPVAAKTSKAVADAKAPAPAPVAEPQPQSQAAGYQLETLGMGDMVRINVFRNPELATEARISERGTILFPLIGEINVVGLTPTEVGKRIAQKLSAGKYVVNPEVTVSIAQINSRQVSVLGNVQKPGRYPLDSTTAKVTDLLALAGGIAPTGDDRITVMTSRDGKAQRHEIDLAAMIRTGDLSKNIELQPGDTIYVGRAPMVYVYGEVQRGGAYRVENNMTVMQAIALGGGITPRGTTRGVQIHRKNGDGQIHKMDAKLTDPVQTDDVIYVRESLF
ncbi:MAG TPA: polysaccharide export protein EpsE [Usitatibacter sp.]|nr:polysaccharide export protein EpsE [Usitatibacter sp.]